MIKDFDIGAAEVAQNWVTNSSQRFRETHVEINMPPIVDTPETKGVFIELKRGAKALSIHVWSVGHFQTELLNEQRGEVQVQYEQIASAEEVVPLLEKAYANAFP